MSVAFFLAEMARTVCRSWRRAMVPIIVIWCVILGLLAADAVWRMLP